MVNTILQFHKHVHKYDTIIQNSTWLSVDVAGETLLSNPYTVRDFQWVSKCS